MSENPLKANIFSLTMILEMGNPNTIYRFVHRVFIDYEVDETPSRQGEKCLNQQQN